MKNLIKKILKRIPFVSKLYQKWNSSKLLKMLILFRVLNYNRKRFITYSGTFTNSKGSESAYLTWLTHVIEKGLAMKDMKPAFGKEKIIELGDKLPKYKQKYGKNIIYNNGIIALAKYFYIHDKNNIKLSTNVLRVYKNLEKDILSIDKALLEKNVVLFNIEIYIQMKVWNFQNLLKQDIQSEIMILIKRFLQNN